MSQYFIRRGSNVVGPVTADQIRQNLASGKIIANDEVATSREGPWEILGTAMGIAGGAGAAGTPAAPTPAPVQPEAADLQPIKAPEGLVPMDAITPVAASPPASLAPVKVPSPGELSAAGGNPSAEPIISTVNGSQIRVDGRPSFAHINIDLAPGEMIIGEADAMASMAGDMDLKAKFNGGFFSGLKKKFLGGESLFINEYTNNTDKPRHLVLAPSTPGDIRQLDLNGDSFCLQPGAFIACTPGVKLGTKWAGFASLIGREGLFKLQVSGTGTIWYGAFGSLIEREIDGQYIVDTGHLVGYDPQIKLKVQMAGGIFSSFFGGEGLVTRVEGKGKIILQTRSLGGLASWLNPILPA